MVHDRPQILQPEIQQVLEETLPEGEDQHPPAIDLDEWEQMKTDMKKIRNKGALKKLG